MIKNKELHYQEASCIKEFQESRLKETLEYVAKHSPFYKRMFAEHNIDISTIKTIEDLQSLPTTSKQDLQLHNADREAKVDLILHIEAARDIELA